MTKINKKKGEKMKEKYDENEKMNIKDILNKNFPSAICQHCSKVTGIQFSGDFRRLVSKNRTLSEINKTLRKEWHNWMNIKNGQIEAMHKMISGLLQLVPEKEKKKAKELTQEMRDEIRHVERVRGLRNENKSKGRKK